jgi:pantoate--beta-alanine ligase
MAMEVIRIPKIMQDTSKNHLFKGRSVGFVPTMGALHEGHLSLVRRAKQDNNITVVSIFVNPIQFGPSEDYAKYPRDIAEDTEKLQKENVDILFLPEVAAMYPEEFLTHIEVEKISEKLCGSFRPGHFRGVATVVTKLFNIVKPTSAYFGQKDFQQTVVIKQMVKDLDMNIDIVICPTVRERDGLAMSSRNMYLDVKQREAATIIYKTLLEASALIKSGIINGKYIQKIMQEKILKDPAVTNIDYIGVYDPVMLEEIYEIKKEVLLAAAIRMGDTRLIDNMLVNLESSR